MERQEVVAPQGTYRTENGAGKNGCAGKTDKRARDNEARAVLTNLWLKSKAKIYKETSQF